MNPTHPRSVALLLALATAPACVSGDKADSDTSADTSDDTSADTSSDTSADTSSDTSADTSDTGARCAATAVLTVSPLVADQADATAAGGAAALLATVPEGCDTVLVFAEAGAYVVTGSLALPTWSTIRFADGAALDVRAGGGVTVDGGVDAGRTRIFAGEGRVDGAPRIDAAYPEWFGAVPDDDADDHAAIQAAVDFFATVALDAGVYDLHGTVTLPGGARVGGPAGDTPTATLRSALVYPATEGFHPTRLLQAADVADVTVHDVVLDGNRHAATVDCWGYPETDNLARFERVAGLLLENVALTGWEANWGAADATLAHVIAILDAEDVALVGVSLTDSRTEGILVRDSRTVRLEGLSTRNTDVWTPLHAFYVEDLTLLDSTFVEDEGTEWTGSTVNLTVRGAYVAGNTFTGGWGVDFGDEVGTTAWGPGDILVEDNTFETVGAGVYFTPYAAGDRVTGVEIRGNTFTLHRAASADDTDEVLRFDAAADVRIVDNVVHVPDTGAGFVRGVSFAGSTADVRVEGNTLSGVDVGVSHSGDSPDGGTLTITGNTITCPAEIRRDSWSGGSTGVWVFRYVAAGFDGIVVEDNVVDARGGWVSLIDYASLYGAASPFVDTLTVTGNTFLPEDGSERNVLTEGAASATVTGNTPSWVDR